MRKLLMRFSIFHFGFSKRGAVVIELIGLIELIGTVEFVLGAMGSSLGARFFCSGGWLASAPCALFGGRLAPLLKTAGVVVMVWWRMWVGGRSG